MEWVFSSNFDLNVAGMAIYAPYIQSKCGIRFSDQIWGSVVLPELGKPLNNSFSAVMSGKDFVQDSLQNSTNVATSVSVRRAFQLKPLGHFSHSEIDSHSLWASTLWGSLGLYSPRYLRENLFCVGSVSTSQSYKVGSINSDQISLSISFQSSTHSQVHLLVCFEPHPKLFIANVCPFTRGGLNGTLWGFSVVFIS